MKLWHKIWVTVLGGILVLVGLVMLVTPGPGLLALAGGLAIWATEYMWAKGLLKRVKDRLEALKERTKTKL